MTMKGSLPEASIRARLKVSAQARATAWPVGTLPVKATPWVSACSTRRAPTRPPPVTTWISPGGRSESASIIRREQREVFSDGFRITALPAAAAAAASQANST